MSQNSAEEKAKYLQGLFKETYVKDIVERNKIKNNSELEELIKERIYEQLANIDNIALMSSLEYPELICILQNAKLVLTDSGGLQEEAPAFGVPLIVLRYNTERNDGVEKGFAILVGADYKRIILETKKILTRPKHETRLKNKFLYGKGNACKLIKKHIDSFFNTFDGEN